MDVMSVCRETKIHCRVAREHFKKMLADSHAGCMTYGNKDDVVECVRKSGEIVAVKAKTYLQKNQSLTQSLHICLQINEDTNPVDRRECVAKVKAQINKLSFEH